MIPLNYYLITDRCYLIISNKYLVMTTIQFRNTLTGLENKMFHFALRLTSNSDNAHDLVQETYLKALTYQSKYSADTNMIAWVFTIMKNTFINEYRRNVKAKTTMQSQSGRLKISFSKDDFYPSVDSIHEEKEIYNKINLLDEEFRVPFLLFLNGYKYKEISDNLDLPLGTVKSRIFFTRKKLSKCLSEYVS